MKKILIVNNNMKVGGVQKSLYNLLWSIDTTKEYDVTLLLFHKAGAYLDDLPKTVKVIECRGPFRFLGRDQCDFHGFTGLVRGGFAALCKVFGRPFAVRLMLLLQPRVKESFDCAISFLHNGRVKAFYGGVPDFVLHRVRAEKKVVFLHGDYRASGVNHPTNNRTMAQFDTVAACSDGCRGIFVQALPHMAERAVTVRNCHRYDKIRAMAEEEPIAYDTARIHVVTVARLTHEKGIERGLAAVANALARGVPLTWHIVGDGAKRAEWTSLADTWGIADHVIFYGEQANPYRYVKNADLFLLPSYHEAAPMVIDEARALGVPILTTATTSAHEMVTARSCGVVCENTEEALTEALYRLTADRATLAEYRKQSASVDNGEALAQWDALFKE